jgi:hypothetical protein
MHPASGGLECEATLLRRRSDIVAGGRWIKALVCIVTLSGAIITQGRPASAFGYKDGFYDGQEQSVTNVDIHRTARSV